MMSCIGNSRRSKKLEANETLQCPKCNRKNIALIFWGYPGDFDSIEEQVERKEIVKGERDRDVTIGA